MRPVNVGVFGYGHYVRGNFLPQFARCPLINIVGVYNRGEERRSQAREDGYWTTGDMDELLAKPELEAVYIGTSNDAHKEHCIAAARAGKHILCDKPLALSLADVDEIIAESSRAGIVTHVNHGAPYSPGFQEFKKIMRDRCGRLMHVWIRSSRGFGNWAHGARHFAVMNPDISGGWTFHHLCHALDEACILVGKKAVKVYHITQKSSDEAPSEELVNALITFEDGETAFLCDGTTIGGFKERGAIGVDADLRQVDRNVTVVTQGPPAKKGRPGILERNVETIEMQSDFEDKSTPIVAQAFAEAIRGGENRLLSFEFVREQYRILDALKRSAQSGETIEL